jgi:urease gamma subunit
MGIKPPTQKYFFFADDIDETIFYNTFEKIKSKVDSGLKINLDESIWLYCGYIIREIRRDNNLNKIKDKLSKLLSPDKVMIGVTDIMKKNTFEITAEKKYFIFDIDSLF